MAAQQAAADDRLRRRLSGKALCIVEAMTNPERELAIDAVDVLNDLMADFAAGTLVLLDYHQRHKEGQFRADQMSAVQKMCLSHVALGCVKLLEFREHFHPVVPEEYRACLKSLNQELKRRDVKKFRNKVAGHLRDNEHQRPLRHSEIMAMLEILTGGHLGSFLRWANNPADNSYPKTIFSIVETLRDAIAAAYSVQAQEVIDR